MSKKNKIKLSGIDAYTRRQRGRWEIKPTTRVKPNKKRKLIDKANKRERVDPFLIGFGPY